MHLPFFGDAQFLRGSAPRIDLLELFYWQTLLRNLNFIKIRNSSKLTALKKSSNFERDDF